MSHFQKTKYYYILDQGLAQDQGGPVYPIYTCPHVLHRVRVTVDQLPAQPAATQCQYTPTRGTGNLKGETNPDGSCPGTENWLCLTCGALRCSRYVNGHGLQHWQETKDDDTTEDPTSLPYPSLPQARKQAS